MGQYVDSNLTKNEVVRYEGKTSLWSLLPIIVIGCFLVPFAGFGFLLWISAVLTYFTTEIAITNKRIIAKSGFIRRKTIEMNIPKIESIQIEQGVLGRVFNFGSIIISGAGNPQAPIRGISNPLRFRSAFFEIQEEIEKPSQHAKEIQVA